MNLKDFVSETLSQILQGVQDAKKNLPEKTGEIDPRIFCSRSDAQANARLITQRNSVIYHVEFDVALSVTEGSDKKGGIGVLVAGIGAGVQGQKKTSSESINRIKFQVPVAFSMYED